MQPHPSIFLLNESLNSKPLPSMHLWSYQILNPIASYWDFTSTSTNLFRAQPKFYFSNLLLYNDFGLPRFLRVLTHCFPSNWIHSLELSRWVVRCTVSLTFLQTFNFSYCCDLKSFTIDLKLPTILWSYKSLLLTRISYNSTYMWTLF